MSALSWAATFLVSLSLVSIVFGLLMAGRLAPSVALVIALALITVICVLAYTLLLARGENPSELATLAATGLGALAGAVTAVWSERKEPPVNIQNGRDSKDDRRNHAGETEIDVGDDAPPDGA